MSYVQFALCRIALLYFYQGGTAPRHRVRRSPRGLCLGRPARRARAVPAEHLPLDQPGSISTRMGARRRPTSASIVQLAAAGSMAPSGRRTRPDFARH